MAARETWNSILPGPPSRNNGGSADLSTTGLFAFASGSNIAIVDPHTMQLISVIPLPPPSPTSLSPFVTSLRWTPQSIRRDLLLTQEEPSSSSSSSHLLLAAGDRQGRIALIDFLPKSVLLWFDSPLSSSKNGIQDLCWLQPRSESWILASIVGSSTILLFSAASGLCFWRYESAHEFLSCIRCDPFDSRHFCVLGFKGSLLSAVVLDEVENGVVIKELQIKTDLSEFQKLETAGISSSSSSSSLPALVVYPLYMVKLAFSPIWKHVLFIVFPRELAVFDLDYERCLSVAYVPRGCGKFFDVLPDYRGDLLCCVHMDGRLSIWKRKHGEQVYIVCSIEELIPFIGTSAPPSLLSVAMSHLDPIFESFSKSNPNVFSPHLNFSFPLDCSEHISVSKTRLISVSDDGKIWNWLLTTEWSKNISNNSKDSYISFHSENGVVRNANEATVPNLIDEPVREGTELPDATSITGSLPSKYTETELEALFKIRLVGQLQLLSSTLTMLAVPTPSLTAILARGGNDMAVPVPLAALGNQSGTIDVVDVSGNAVASCFSVHTSMVRGLRFLGNSRLVSFSYSKANEKIGGYNNMLVVTCLRSGLHRTFRTLRKPERAPLRALRASSSGRYLVILFRDAPVEIWAMTKTPIMLRSLALPFTVVEWSLPICRKTGQQRLISPKDHTETAQMESSSSQSQSLADQKTVSSDESQDCSECFAFALVNGALGVFEVNGRRIRDSRPKWPSSSFVSSDGMVTAMAFRLPHVVMGDRSGNIRWWDIVTGHSSAFNTHRDGIRRIKFSPVVIGDQSRGRIAVLYVDNTFSIFDLDSQDPLANSLLQPQFPGTLVLELDWLPLRTDKDDPLVLCIAGADSSFRLIEINISNKKIRNGILPRAMREKFRPVPLCLPALLPTPHALALRMVLQYGIEPSWLISSIEDTEKSQTQHESVTSHSRDLRSYIIGKQLVGDSAVPEMLLKVLEPYHRKGGVLVDEWAHLYSTLVHKGSAARFAFAAAVFGDSMEALFWSQLPYAMVHLMNCLVKRSIQKGLLSSSVPNLFDSVVLNRITSKGKSSPPGIGKNQEGHGRLKTIAFEQRELWENANQRITWHEKLEGEADVQNRVHELVSVGSLEAAVSLLLSTSPESSFFYTNALRAVALSSTVSRSLLELAVKVVAANMVRTDELLCGIHLLCAVGRYQEACSQLQDAGRWTDAATLASTYLEGSDYSRVLHRWAVYLLNEEHDMWRALILFVAVGALQDALAALREAQQPDTAAMFVVAFRELHSVIAQGLDGEELERFTLSGLSSDSQDVIAVFEYYEHYQRKLVHLCMDTHPWFH